MPHSDITLLICTHNNAGVLPRALESIASQRVDAGVRWDVLVIDNNCSDDTRDVVESFQSDPRMPPTRIEGERRQGVGYARKTGLAGAEGHLVGFVDDDCILDENWVAAALAFAEEHPRAGAVGSHNDLLWESPPPPHGEHYGESLARQNFGDRPIQLPSVGRRIPCGAGLLLRREAVLDSGYLSRGVLRGRNPYWLGAGEDAEVAFFVRNAGHEVWLNPKMRLHHFIPSWRTELPYLCRLHRGFGRAESRLHLLSMKQPPTLAGRLHQVGRALQELHAVAERYRAVADEPEQRPSLWISFYHAMGYTEGALVRAVIGHRR